MRTILLLCLCGMLLGCATDQYHQVLIPLSAKQRKIEVPALPYLPIQSITEKSPPATVSKAYVATVKLLLNDNVNLREAVQAYQD